MIKAVAIKVGTSLWVLPPPNRHHNVIRWWTQNTPEEERDYDSVEEGFVNEKGEFLDRREAFLDALANNQIIRNPDPTKYQGMDLYSEDLW